MTSGPTICAHLLDILTRPTVRQLAELHPDRAVRFSIPHEALSREIEDIQTALPRGGYRRADPLYDECFEHLALHVLTAPVWDEVESLNIHNYDCDKWIAHDDEGRTYAEGVVVCSTAGEAVALKMRLG